MGFHLNQAALMQDIVGSIYSGPCGIHDEIIGAALVTCNCLDCFVENLWCDDKIKTVMWILVYKPHRLGRYIYHKP